MGLPSIPEVKRLTELSNGISSDLKSSFTLWEELAVKSGKFYSALKIFTQSYSPFINSIQRLADAAMISEGGSKEIGAHLTRLCMRQQTFEIQMKSMSNYLVNGLTASLPSKMDEWRRQLQQLEKDRSRQVKRARSELKKALSEATRSRKKFKRDASISVDQVPLGNEMKPILESDLANLPSPLANAFRDVQAKVEALEVAERSSLKNLMLEERSRFCFLISCLLPIMECQSELFKDFSMIDELIKVLAQAAEHPDELLDSAHSVLNSAASKSTIDSSVRLSGSNGGTQADFSDADSGRLTMDGPPIEQKMYDDPESCSLNSFSQFSIVNGSADVSGSGDSCSIQVCYRNPAPYGRPAVTSILPSVHSSRNSTVSDHVNFTPPTYTGGVERENQHVSLVSSCHLPQSFSNNHLGDENQFPTLRRPAHKFVAEASSNDRPVVDPNWLNACVHSDGSDDSDSQQTDEADDARPTMSVVNVGKTTTEPGDYVEVQQELGGCPLPSNHIGGTGLSRKLSGSMNLSHLVSGRHTINSTYKTGAPVRADVTNLSFVNRAEGAPSRNSVVESQSVLYPNQALPPPGYTNLDQLANAAKQKFSMNPLFSTSVDASSGFPSPAARRWASMLNHRSPLSQSFLSLTRPSRKSSSESIHSTSAAPPKGFAPQVPSMSPSATPYRYIKDRRVSNMGAVPSYGGSDPYSLEVDNLDRFGCASVSTRTSSATNDSQRSSICVSQASNSSEYLRHAQEATIQYSGISPLRTSIAASDSYYSPPSLPTSASPPLAPSVPPPKLWSEDDGTTATLMSELSIQLQQLAINSRGDPVPTQDLRANDAVDDLDLPPPPPECIFK